MATQIPLYRFHADPKQVVTNVGGIWRPVTDWQQQGIDINSLPTTSDATYRGTSGGGMAYQDLLRQQAIYDESAGCCIDYCGT